MVPPDENGGRAAEAWLENAISGDPLLGDLLPQLRRLAKTDTPVLIVGEVGTGVELVARTIHNLSPRAAHPFVLLDCNGLSDTLAGAELVGVEGEAGGRAPLKPGVFEQAGKGSVLLGEVSELPQRCQEALMRILERHEAVRVNGTTPVRVEARCFASTGIDLRARVTAGVFREDLYQLLARDTIVLRPLRERPDEVSTLAQFYLEMLGRSVRRFTPDAEALLRGYTWPGNLHELRETVDEAAIAARGEEIGVESLPPRLRGGGERPAGPLPSLRDVEMRHIERVLQEARGNQRRASRILGISRWSLSRRLRKYGMQPRSETEG
jgi:DNA-binding NtrC family response regulator